MSKLFSKLRKMKITLTSHFTRYINENYMKISKSTIDYINSKKLPLASTSASWRLQNLLQAFPTISLFKLVNAAVVLTFSLSLVLLGFFLVPHLNTLNTSKWLQTGQFGSLMSRVMCSWNIFSQSIFCFPACVACHKILLPDVGSSSSHLHLGQR